MKPSRDDAETPIVLIVMACLMMVTAYSVAVLRDDQRTEPINKERSEMWH